MGVGSRVRVRLRVSVKRFGFGFGFGAGAGVPPPLRALAAWWYQRHRGAARRRLLRRWHLGVQSSMAPADMMLEIFRALRTLQFEWKIVAQYALKCRPCPRAAALPPHEAPPPRPNPNA